jgi:periplasmic protein TonB
MEISNILTADILDIIFEGRNKDYGAYELRRSYKRRLATSLTVMLSVILLMFVGFAFSNKVNKPNAQLLVNDVMLQPPPPPEQPVQPPPPPVKPLPPPPQVQMARFTPPRIVQDDKVPPDEKPPVNEDLDDVKIGDKNQDGLKDDGMIAPPGDELGKGIIEAPKKEEEDWNRTFTKVEIESLYPGGPAAWERFLHKYLSYPQAALDNEIQGTVVVQFIVDKEGVVSDVHAISGPEELRSEAVRVIKKSGKWTPAVQNGNTVKSYKTQPIGFQMPTE